MGWLHTYTEDETDKYWERIIKVDKSIVLPWIRRAVSVMRVLLYGCNLFTDIIIIIMLGMNPPDHHQALLGPLAWKITLAFMLQPFLLTLIAVIIDIVKSPTCSKILLLPVAIICSPSIQIGILVSDAQDNFQPVPTGRNKEKSDQVMLNVTLLGALPVSLLLVLLLVDAAQFIDPLATWKVIKLVFNIVIFSFSLATSTSLFKTNSNTRLIFFVCSLITITSRVLTAGTFFMIPSAVLLLVSISVWLVKRLCHGFCPYNCCVDSAPLADSHHQCGIQSLLHVPTTWLMTAFGNAYTSTGLILSTLTIMYAVFWAVFDGPYVNGPESLGGPEYFNINTFFAILAFLMNLMFVFVSKCRSKVGDAWLNIDQETGQAQLY